MVSFDNIAQNVGSMISFLPSSITGSEIVMQVNLARLSLSNYLGVTIGSPIVEDIYTPVVTYKTAALICSTMIGYGNDDFAVANIKSQRDLYIEEVKNEINALGVAIPGRYGVANS